MRLPTSPRGAVLAVFHDYDGFVRIRPCGLVASHCRSWGSPGFLQKADVAADIPHSSRAPLPFEAFPSWPSGHRHQPIAGLFTECPAPLVVGPLSFRAPAETCTLSKSRPHLRGVPSKSPLQGPSRCRVGLPDAPLGFLQLQAFTCRCGRRNWSAEAATFLFGARPKPGPSRRCTRRSESTVPTTSSLPILSTMLLPPK